MATRLTKYDRERMARALAMFKLDEEGQRLASDSAALFREVYDSQYDATTQRAMKALTKLHRKAFAVANNVSLNVRGRRFSVGQQRIGNSGVWWTPEVASLSVLNDFRYNDLAFLDGDLADRLSAFSDDLLAFGPKVEAAYRKALSALNAFSTGEKIAKDWPEAIPVIGSLIPTQSRALPVVQMDAINDEFGLPPETEKLAA